MADSTRNPENDSSDPTPTTRRRRRAGAPAGAPAPVTPEPLEAPEQSAAPRTIVAQQSDAPAEPAPSAPTKRPRRRAGAPAGAPVIPAAEPDSAIAEPESTTAEPENAAPEAPEAQPDTEAQPERTEPKRTRRTRTQRRAAAPEPTEPTEPEATEPAADTDELSTDAESTEESEDHPVVDDLRALATSRGAADESGTAKDPEVDDRARRREQVQMDFASLLFQAPTPQPRTTVGAGDAPVGGETQHVADADEDSSQDDDTDADGSGRSDSSEQDETGTSGRSRSRRGRTRRSSRRGTGSDDTVEEDTSTEDSSEEEPDEDHETAGSSRRRRRRGGRGRRGRGRGEDDDSSAEEDESDDEQDSGSHDSRDSRDSEGADGRSRRGGHSAGSAESDDTGGTGDSDSSDHGEGSDHGSSSSSSSRRRRRRRRSGGGNGNGHDESSSTTDDPPNTVVKVREARDEVKAVKGSTRLEAKRQRRREGRDNGRKRNVITEAEFLARRESVKRSMVVRERPGRTQIAVLEDDVLVEHYVAQKSQTSMVGNVYMGKVQNVLPSMEAAFVDIGKGRNAVLYAGEVNWDAVGLEGQPRRIELALKSGDPVLVQVTKDPIGHKGARLTSQISLPGRYVVFVTGGTMTGISRKLPDTERARLKKIMRQIIPEDAGVIVRTASEGASEEELTRDVERLRAQWDKIQKAQKSKSAPASLSQEPDIAIKVVRDVFNEDFTSLIVEGDKVYDDVHSYVSEVAPDLLERVTKHVGEKDVFAKHRIDEQLLKAMDRKVYLPSGGSLVIDRTEAMTVVDVNTGKFTGSGGSLEETVTKNNIESAEEIVRQLRLRDIGGIIVIDFIDMVLEANRDLVLRRLVECLGRDRTKHQVAEVTSLGLVQMTRKRVGQGLVETFSANCEHCNGRGLVVDIDGDLGHDHSNGGNGGNGNGGNGGGDDSSKSSKRRNRRSRGGSAKEDSSSEDSSGEDSRDVHRLEDDADSRAAARATIASIAAASTSAASADAAGGAGETGGADASGGTAGVAQSAPAGSTADQQQATDQGSSTEP